MSVGVEGAVANGCSTRRCRLLPSRVRLGCRVARSPVPRRNERFADGLVVRTFTMSTSTARPFEVAALDLYPVVDCRIMKKDTRWKHQALVR